MIDLSPGIQLLVMGVVAILLRYASGQQAALPTPAGAAVMAIGIFIAAPLQQIRPLAPLVTESLSIALLVIWAAMAASYLAPALPRGIAWSSRMAGAGGSARDPRSRDLALVSEGHGGSAAS